MPQVAFDAVSSMDTASTTSASFTLAHPVAVQPNLLMEIKLAWYDVLLNGAQLNSVTYGTTTLFQHDAATTTTNLFNVELWASINEQTGTNTATATFSAPVAGDMSVESYYNVRQESPGFGLGTAAVTTGLSGVAQVQVLATSTKSLVTDAVTVEKMLGADVITQAATQTLQTNRFATHASGYITLGSSRRGGLNGNENMRWTQSVSATNWAIINLEILANPDHASPFQLLLGR